MFFVFSLFHTDTRTQSLSETSTLFTHLFCARRRTPVAHCLNQFFFLSCYTIFFLFLSSHLRTLHSLIYAFSRQLGCVCISFTTRRVCVARAPLINLFFPHLFSHYIYTSLPSCRVYACVLSNRASLSHQSTCVYIIII